MGIGRWIAVLLAALLAAGALSACDSAVDPSGPPSGAVSVAAVPTTHDALVALYAGDHPSRRDLRDGDCFATKFLRATTDFQLASSGVVDHQGQVVDQLPPLDPPTAQDWADAQFACVDFVDASTRSVALAVGGHGNFDPAAYETCLRAALTEDQMKQAVVASLRGRLEAPAVNRLANAQSRCARA